MQKKILFIKHLDSSFIRRDEALLSRQNQLTVFHFKNNKGWRILPGLVRQSWFMIKEMVRHDLVFVWFADFHAVIPVLFSRLFRRKSVIVIGGVDAAYLPQYHYGTKTKWLGKMSVFISTTFATRLIAVSHFTRRALLANVSAKLAEKTKVVYNCYDPTSLNKRLLAERRNIITVCLASKVETLFIKGVDFYNEVAAAMPDQQFIVAGLTGEAWTYLNARKAPNLIILKPMPYENLLQLYAECKVICQFSRHEAFGLALIEGIAAACFPVGYAFGGTQEILAGTDAKLIKQLNVNEAVEAIRYGLEAPESTCNLIQGEVLNRFKCQLRLQGLQEIIHQL